METLGEKLDMSPVHGPSPSATPDQMPSNAHAPLSNNSRLESLPAELRLALLSNLDFDGLDALVHTSPVFHQSYRAFRGTILRTVLARTLRNIAPDAIAESVSRASQVIELTSFTESHESLPAQGPDAILNDGVSEDQVLDMVHFYRCTIQPLIAAFMQWAQERFKTKEGPSYSEKTRITRALYRLQLYNTVRSRTESKSPQRPSYREYLKEQTLLAKFFSRYRPWELDEVLCIYSFAENMYGRILEDIVRDLPPNWSEYISSLSEDRAKLADRDRRRSYAQGSTELGLGFLQDLLSRRSDHDSLVPMVGRNMRWPRHERFERLCRNMKSLLTREDQPLEDATEEGETQRRGDRSSFQGDDPDAVGPPLAWTMFWEGRYVDRYGNLPGFMRPWGSVMWDAQRILRLTQGGKGRECLVTICYFAIDGGGASVSNSK